MILQGKAVLVTGASGFLGTALVTRLESDTGVKCIYVLVRGGANALIRRWSSILPPSIVASLKGSHKIRVIDGETTLPFMGMDVLDADEVRQNVDIIVHAVSSTSLSSPAESLRSSVISASLSVARFALNCRSLQKFVFISTAYVNSHLHQSHDGIETKVHEKIYHLELNSQKEWDTQREWEEVLTSGITSIAQAHGFPWAYAYANHLAERLLLRLFQTGRRSGFDEKDSNDGYSDDEGHQVSPQLLIVRPSIIGPAISYPLPGFEVPGSALSSVFAAELRMTFRFRLRFASRFADPGYSANLNEIPVDIVVNRILMHLEKDTSGVVHAVASKETRPCFNMMWSRMTYRRSIPWTPKAIWTDVNWHSSKLNSIALTYVIHGTSYDFIDQSSPLLTTKMSDTEREQFPVCCGIAEYERISNFSLWQRRQAIKKCAELYCSKRGWPKFLGRLLG